MHWLHYHWHRITPLHLLLFPISLLFGALVLSRRLLYYAGIFSRKKINVPVIVIGNISVGGTGKTPLTLALAQLLVERGWQPLIISRGYGGTSRQPRRVDTLSTAQQVGDEPLLMARRNLCPVWTGKDRAAAAQSALLAHPHCDVVLCDDGLQHYRLGRDIEIAVIDEASGCGNGFLLPAGPLREPQYRLATVDAVVMNRQAQTLRIPAARKTCTQDDEASVGSQPPRYTMRLDGAVFYNLLNPGKQVGADHFRMLSNHAVAGIGNPQRYFTQLQSLGIDFTPHAFPDHHPYSALDLNFVNCDAVLMTEKDAVKCAALADARYWVLRVDAQIDTSLIDLILRKIQIHGRKTA